MVIRDGLYRDIAITGITTYQEYLFCREYCENTAASTKPTEADFMDTWSKEAVFSDDSTDINNFWNWGQDPAECTSITLEDFITMVNPKKEVEW